MNKKLKPVGPQQHILRDAKPCYTETMRVNRPDENLLDDYPASIFEQETGTKYGDGEKSAQRRVFAIKRNGGAGLRVSIEKFGEKRTTSLSTEIGLDEIDMLITFLSEVRSQCRNYYGERLDLISGKPLPHNE